MTNLDKENKLQLGRELTSVFQALDSETTGRFTHADILKKVREVGMKKGYLHHKPKPTKKPWIILDEEYQRISKAVHEARLGRGQSPAEHRQYRKLSKKLRKVRKRIKWEQDIATGAKLQHLYESNNIAEFYEIKAEIERRGDGLTVDAIDLEDGTTTHDTHQILAEMQRYMETLLGEAGTAKMQEAERILGKGSGRVPEEPQLQSDFTWREVERALTNYGNEKAQGPGSQDIEDICIEILKNAHVHKEDAGTVNDFRTIIARWMSKGLWNTANLDADLSSIRCMLLPKIKGTRNLKKFRGISVMNTMRRLMSIMILHRLDPYLERAEIYMENQFGFRRKKSIMHAGQIFQQLQWLSKNRQRDIYVTYLDIAKAYDNVDWALLERILEHYGVPAKLRRLIMQLLENSEMFVRFRGQKSRTFKLRKAVPQGDPLSPLLFSIYMTFLFRECYKDQEEQGVTLDSETIRKMEEDQGNTGPEKAQMRTQIQQLRENEGFNVVYLESRDNEFMPREQPLTKYEGKIKQQAAKERITAIMYADDTITGGTTMKSAIETTRKHIASLTIGGLKVNTEKMEWMKLVGQSTDEAEQCILEQKIIKRVENQTYLGSFYTQVYDQGRKNCQRRVAMAHRIMDMQVKSIMRNTKIQRKLKLIVYRSDVVPVATHGVACWNITANGGTLEQFQRKVLLKILNRSWRDRIPSIYLYETVRKMGMKIYPMKLLMAERKLRFVGMLRRQKGGDLASKIFNGDMVGRHWHQSHAPEHFTETERAMKLLGITHREADENFASEKKWTKLLSDKKESIYLKMVEERRRKDNTNIRPT